MADNAKLVIEIADGSRGGPRDPNLPPPLPPQALTPVGAGGGGGSAGAGTALQPAGRSPGPGVSTVPAFDRPIPVIIVGPKSFLSGFGSQKNGKDQGDDEKGDLTPPKRQHALQSTADMASKLGVDLAHNRNAAIAATGLRVVGSGLMKLGAVGVVTGGAMIGLAVAIEAVGKVVNAFIERGRELARFDPRLAAASGMADVKRIQADIREAQRLGDGMARLIEKQAELEVTVRELMLPVKEFVVEQLADIMGILADAARFILGRGKEAKPEKLNAIMADFLGMIDDRFDGVGAVVGNKFNDNPDRAAAAKLGIPILDI